MMKAELSIMRPGGIITEAEIRIMLKLERARTITATISPEEFALALTGLSDRPVELALRNVALSAAIQPRFTLKQDQPDCDCDDDDTSCDCWDHPSYSLYVNGHAGYGQAVWSIAPDETTPRYWCSMLGLEQFAVNCPDDIPAVLRERLSWLGPDLRINFHL